MDGAVVSDAPPVSDGDADIVRIPEKTYTEEFYEAFPFYLSIGMTADEFWNQDCLLTKMEQLLCRISINLFRLRKKKPKNVKSRRRKSVTKK